MAICHRHCLLLQKTTGNAGVFLWAAIDFRLPTLTNYVHGKMVNVVVDGEAATKLLVASL
jgi:hypothetical protein